MACSSSAFAVCPIAIDSFCFASASNPKAIEFVPKDFDFAPKAVAPSFASASTPTATAFPNVLFSAAFALLPIATESFAATVLSPYAVPFSPFASACQPTATAVFPSVLLFPPTAIEPPPLAMAFPLPLLSL